MEKMIPVEHERRFVPKINELPFSFTIFPFVFINQGYLEDEKKTRIRDETELISGKHTYTKTIKSGTGVSRYEDEKEITKDEFEDLLLDVKCFLTKIRYFVAYDGVDLQLNLFNGELNGYVQIEVEFESNEEAIAFIPPVWFGIEVTDDQKHGNYYLAKFGKPVE